MFFLPAQAPTVIIAASRWRSAQAIHCDIYGSVLFLIQLYGIFRKILDELPCLRLLYDRTGK